MKSEMSDVLHVTSGDIAGESLAKAGLPGEVFVWHDILYDGPRRPGWPTENILDARALFLEEFTAGGLDRALILETFHNQYRRLHDAAQYGRIVLWFDACLFDQSMLVHILACLDQKGLRNVELICIDAFPGIEPYHGLGQLQSQQLASRYATRRPVTDEQFRFAVVVDNAFASQDVASLTELSEMSEVPLPWIPAAVTRWLQELPDPQTGLGRLESLALAAIRGGCETPGQIFESVASADTPPQFWGDTTLWGKINRLMDWDPPLVQIEGPMTRLPQWASPVSIQEFKIKALQEITTDWALRFAEEWIAAWNSHDLERILGHYAEDFEMCSPLIIEILNEPSGVLRGKEAVRRYWAKGLDAQPPVRFELLAVHVGVNRIGVVYKSAGRRFVVEVLTFNETRRVTHGVALYGDSAIAGFGHSVMAREGG